MKNKLFDIKKTMDLISWLSGISKVKDKVIRQFKYGEYIVGNKKFFIDKDIKYKYER